MKPQTNPCIKNPNRGVQNVFEGAPYDLNPKPAPKIQNPKRWVSTVGLWFSSRGCIVFLGQTKAPVGNNYNTIRIHHAWYIDLQYTSRLVCCSWVIFEGCQIYRHSSRNSGIHYISDLWHHRDMLGLMTSVDVHLVCRPGHFDEEWWTAFLISTSYRLSLALVLSVLSAVGRAPPIWGKFLTGPKVFDKRAEAIEILHAPSSWDAGTLTTYSTTDRKVAARNHACKVRRGQINKRRGGTNEETGNAMLTLQGINISHLGKRKIIFKMPFWGDMLVPWRVDRILDRQRRELKRWGRP